MEISKLKEISEAITPVEATNKPLTLAVLTQCKSKKLTPEGAYGTGRRKNAIARVWVKAGKGKIIVNKKKVSDYFAREIYVTSILHPFAVTNTTDMYDVVCTVKGGGTTGQAGAIVHGIARAVSCFSEEFQVSLHKAGLLTRDSRIVERKKYGKRKARKSTQFSKR